MSLAVATWAGSGPLDNVSNLRSDYRSNEHLRNMQIHLFITLLPCLVVHEATATSLDLDAATGFLLDMFDILSTGTYDLGTEIEARNGFEIDGDTLFWPFAASVLVTFLRFRRFATTEAAFINEIRKLLLH